MSREIGRPPERLAGARRVLAERALAMKEGSSVCAFDALRNRNDYIPARLLSDGHSLRSGIDLSGSIQMGSERTTNEEDLDDE